MNFSEILLIAPLILPVLGVFFLIGIESYRTTRWIALTVSLLSSLLCLFWVGHLSFNHAEFVTAHFEWIQPYSIHFALHLTGWSSLYLIVVAVFFPTLMIHEWERKNFKRGLLSIFLFFQSALYGAVLSFDLFLFFFFWFLLSLLTFFIVGLWGSDSKSEAVKKTIIQHSVSNMFVFIGALLVYFCVDPHTFYLQTPAISKLTDKATQFFGFDVSTRKLAFVFFSIGFLIRAPLVPFQGWFKCNAKELSCVHQYLIYLSSGPLAFFVFANFSYTMFKLELAEYSKWIVIYGAIQVVYSAVTIFTKKSIRLIYSDLLLGFFGFSLLGLGMKIEEGLTGAALYVFASLFGLLGLALVFDNIIEKTKSDDIDAVRDFKESGTFFSVTGAILFASLVGAPGTVGFMGLALLLIGVFREAAVAGFFCVFGLVLLSGYLLTLYHKIFLRRTNGDALLVASPTTKNKVTIVPICFVACFFGVFCFPLVELVRIAVKAMIQDGL